MPHEQIGSPLYDLSAEHSAALLALGALLIVGAYLLGRGRMAARAPIDVLLVALVAGSAAIHVGLAVGHADGPRVLFALDALLLALVARRLVRGGPAGRLGVVVLGGSIGAYWLSVLGGEPPDQLGVATKLGEILALAIVLRPGPRDRVRALRSLAGNVAIALLVLGTATSSWIGAFRAGAHAHAGGAADHVHGRAAPPGTVLPAVPPRDPTPAERVAADRLLAAARVALARYADPAVAAAEGYRVEGLAGLDFHATNPAYERDGRVLDPGRPEALVYAVAPNGRPVLLGAVFQMTGLSESGPAIGGPLTVWHAHEHVCVSLTPPALAGILSPLGMCPVGSIDVPRTPEMIHLWLVPGAPQPFGDLDDAWRRAYVEVMARR